MPHKRAKHSARNASRDSLGFDRVPTEKAGMDDIPHSARLLFAGPPPKRRRESDQQEVDASLKIRPNERMRDFRERVDNTFSADINATIKRGQRSESNSRKRERRRELLKAKKRAANPALAHEDVAADWAKAAEKRSLHDVAQAPPVLTARPKERRKQPPTILEAQAASRPKPSLARQRILDEERDIAVKKYREHKKAKEQHIPSPQTD